VGLADSNPSSSVKGVKPPTDPTTVRAAIFCPVHHQRDCSPLLNGCSRVNEAHEALDRLIAKGEQ